MAQIGSMAVDIILNIKICSIYAIENSFDHVQE